MMRKLLMPFVLVLGSLLILGCIDTIMIDLPEEAEGRLVIDGVVERSPDIYRFFVRVSSTFDLNTDLVDKREVVDIELIYDGKPVFDLRNGEDNVMEISAFHQLYGGNPEEALFNIRVHTPEGNIFESLPQKIIDGPEGSTLQFGYQERPQLNELENLVTGKYVKVQVSTPVVNSKGERVSMRWDISGVYRFPEVAWTDDPFFFPKTCYVYDFVPVNQVNVLKSSSIHGDFVDRFEIGELEADHRFSSGYYITAIQKSISEPAADYWDQVRQSIEREGTIFDPPVGAVKSNIRQIEGSPVEVLGYFYTAGIDTLRHLSTRDETGNQLHLCAFQTVSEACCDCLIIVNSTLDKPAFWK